MNIDLHALTRKELVRLRGDVDKAISTVADRERRAAVEAAERVAAEHGFTLSELTTFSGAKPGRAKAKTPAKYRNPENHAETWSGRGRKPRWILAAETSGQSISDFLI